MNGQTPGSDGRGMSSGMGKMCQFGNGTLGKGVGGGQMKAMKKSGGLFHRSEKCWGTPLISIIVLLWVEQVNLPSLITEKRRTSL